MEHGEYSCNHASIQANENVHQRKCKTVFRTPDPDKQQQHNTKCKPHPRSTPNAQLRNRELGKGQRGRKTEG